MGERRRSVLGLVTALVIASVAAAEPPPEPRARVNVLPPHAPRDVPARSVLSSLVRGHDGWVTRFGASAPAEQLPEYQLDIRVTDTELTPTTARVTVTLCIEQTSPIGGTSCVSDHASVPLSMPSGPSVVRASEAAARATWSAAQQFIDGS